jgi:hypothetical protein
MRKRFVSRSKTKSKEQESISGVPDERGNSEHTSVSSLSDVNGRKNIETE